jgi:hypothetical protein
MAVISKIEEPVAVVLVRWRTSDEGGRQSGPPTASVYAATAVFCQEGDDEVQPDWPASADQSSVLLEKFAELEDGNWRCKLGFLVPELVAEHIILGAALLIMEGPRVVATAEIIELLGRPL